MVCEGGWSWLLAQQPNLDDDTSRTRNRSRACTAGAPGTHTAHMLCKRSVGLLGSAPSLATPHLWPPWYAGRCLDGVYDEATMVSCSCRLLLPLIF
jgi:hypothetical protein